MKIVPVICSVIALSTLPTLSHAHERGHGNGGREVAAVVGGVILGSIIADASRPRYVNPEYAPRPVYPNEGNTGGLYMKPVTRCYIETLYTADGRPVDFQRCVTTMEPGY